MLKNRFKREFEDVIDEKTLESVFDFFSPYIRKEKIDSIRVLKMKESGMGVTEISRFFGVSRTAIYKKLKQQKNRHPNG